MDFEVFKLLDAGGNLALFALVYIMWKFNERLVKLETTLKMMLRQNGFGEGR